MSIIAPRQHDNLHCVYFYYVKFNGTAFEMKSYYYFDEDTPIRNDHDLITIIGKLAINAKRGDFAPPPFGTTISAAPWRRKSFMVILMDDNQHQFPNEDALIIDCLEVAEEINHSFFNARKLDINLAGNAVTALCCVNLMQHRDNRNMEDRDPPERYEVKYRPNGPRASGVRDDGGTNQGGPLPPPIIPFGGDSNPA